MRRDATRPNPNGAAALERSGEDGSPLGATVTANAHPRSLARTVAEIHASGATSLRAIAAELGRRGILTRRGGRRHVSTVRNLLRRHDAR